MHITNQINIFLWRQANMRKIFDIFIEKITAPKTYKNADSHRKQSKKHNDTVKHDRHQQISLNTLKFVFRLF